MAMAGENIVNALSALLVVTSLFVVQERQPKRAALLYGVQSFVLVSVFAALAFFSGAKELYLWAVSAFVTKTILVPAILYRALRQFDPAQQPPGSLSPSIAMALAAVALVVSAAIVTPIHLPASAAFKPALMVSLAHFFLGLACIITQRNIVKQIFGYCLMENGSHLTLALLANQAPELVEIGIATDAIFAVVVMTFFARRIQAALHSVDDRELMTLKG
jgi:hydrogenase-4 component E